MVIDVNWTHCGDHFAIYTNIKPLCCTPETDICINYTSIEQIKWGLGLSWNFTYKFQESLEL